MTDATTNAETIIEKIDGNVLRPTTHLVVRALHQHMRLDAAVQQRTLGTFDRDEQHLQGAELQREIWTIIEALPINQQSGLRLSNCLARPDELIDGHLAEYLMLWARQQGLTEQQIIDAFHMK
jgi:hypothetical protein